MLFRLWARVLFDFGASHSFIVASCVKDLGLEVESLEEPLHVNSPLGTRVSVDKICRDYELEILRILLTMDLKVMDMLEFDVILGMDWLTTHRVVIDCDRRRITAYIQDDVCVMFVNDSRWHGRLVGCLASLTLEDEVRRDLGVPRVVCEYEDVFSDELPR